MYAVITTGGKQHRVTEGETLKVEKLEADVGATINFDQVLLVVDGDKFNLGKPYLKGAKVAASIVRHGRDKKINIVKFKRRKHHRKQMGHRQYFTEIKIEKISG